LRAVRILQAALVWIAACTPEAPSRVFVPADSYTESVDVTTAQGDSARIVVMEALLLHGVRRSGPWVEVEHASLPPDACWWARPPEPLEAEVAGNLRWHAEPLEGVEFGGLRPDLARDVRFSRPGRYVLWAESSGWCSEPYSGDTLVVEVVTG